VVVRAGVYRESVAIRSNHLTLRGAGDGRRGTVIKPGSDQRCEGGGSGICILRHKTSSGGVVPTKDTRVVGFRIQGFDEYGAEAIGARDAFFRNNTFVRNDEYGLAAFRSRRTTVLSSVAKDAEAGFYIGDSAHSGAVLRGNRARRNHDFGFFLRDASHGLARRNVAIQNCMGFILLNTGAPGGVQHWRISENRVLRNQRRCAEGGGEPPISGTGIALAGARNNLIRKNTVRGNRPTGSAFIPGGIVLFSSAPFGGSNAAHNRIARNRAFRNQPADIIWDGNGQANTFEHNRCGSSQPNGLCD
jgi:hypothetical protein